MKQNMIYNYGRKLALLKLRFASHLGLALALGLALTLSSCNDWLDLLPNNEQVTDKYWQNKEAVEQVLASGYLYMGNAAPELIRWGELRGGNFYNNGTGQAASKMQNFDMLPSNQHSQYATMYQIILAANSVLRYAPGVLEIDDTYYQSMMQSHLCEAYFQRAWAYSILVKNYKEVPLVLEAYVNDDAEFNLPKASESEIIAQIKADVTTALASGAAKGSYAEEKQTKSRATKWSLYALMADICLWNHEYDECIRYANLLLEAKETMRPVFVSDYSQWFNIFSEGLTNGSIFELYWDRNLGTTNSFSTIFPIPGEKKGSEAGFCNFTTSAREKLIDEYNQVCYYCLENNIPITSSSTGQGRVGRTYLATFYGSSDNMSLWKYRGTEIENALEMRVKEDANFILYRMADVMLMKAEALVMKGAASWKEAVTLINRIRNRALLPAFIDLESSTAEMELAAMDEWSMLKEVLHQRDMEFVGEGHRWYDLLRLARYDATFAPEGTVEDEEGLSYQSYKTQGMGKDDFKYKTRAIELIVDANETTSDQLLTSVLQNSWLWYLPLPEGDIKTNKELVQNPGY